MNQFKEYSGHHEGDYATSCQQQANNDDNIGDSPSSFLRCWVILLWWLHHAACTWAMEFISSPERSPLWIACTLLFLLTTMRQLRLSLGVAEDHHPSGREDNFWAAGPTGPVVLPEIYF